MKSPIEARETVCEGASAGVGLFISSEEGVTVGTLLTRYPGKPRWFKMKRNGELYESSQYTIVMGIFKVRDGDRVVSRSLAWDIPENYVANDNRTVGHLVNSSYPRCLEEGYRSPNAVWGFRITRLELDCSIDPEIQLWLISARTIPLNTQILVDYHWVFSYGGLWCFDHTCELCIDGLKSFVKSL